MTKPIIAWSFSALETFENCPRKFWATKIAKKVSDANTYNRAGDFEHRAFEDYTKKGLPLPASVQPFQPLLDRVRAAPGEKLYEHKMTIDAQFQVCDWRDGNRAMVRAAADMLIINGSKATYLDWKSGKFRPKDDQIELTSLMVFRHFPQVQQVAGGLVFYRYQQVHRHIVHVADAPALWAKFLARAAALEQAKKADEWPAKPNPLCAYCPYKECPHNTNKEAR